MTAFWTCRDIEQPCHESVQEHHSAEQHAAPLHDVETSQWPADSADTTCCQPAISAVLLHETWLAGCTIETKGDSTARYEGRLELSPIVANFHVVCCCALHQGCVMLVVQLQGSCKALESR